LKIDKLTLYKFRNYNEINFNLNSGLNVIIGKNGQGKTNLIEAIYLLSNKGLFRPGTQTSLVSKIDNPLNHMQISAIFSKNDQVHQLKYNIQNSKKKLLINNNPYNSKNTHNALQTVIFSPESLQAIKSGPEQRRLLIDEILLMNNPNNIRHLNEYKKTLKTKNKILRDYKNNKTAKEHFHNLIDSVNELFLNQNQKLTELRIEAIRSIITQVEDVYSMVNRKNVDISVEYSISDKNVYAWSTDEIAQFSEKRLSELYQAEMSLGSSLMGAHRHDISILCNGEDSRYYCSQGQQRAIILSFKIAQILKYIEDNGEAPILLLDDVLSELDKEKRSYIVEFVNNINAQIFITSTELLIKEKLEFKKDFKIFEIENGKIKKDVKGVLSV
jgi:DNA replication and repair protein RecF